MYLRSKQNKVLHLSQKCNLQQGPASVIYFAQTPLEQKHSLRAVEHKHRVAVVCL